MSPPDMVPPPPKPDSVPLPPAPPRESRIPAGEPAPWPLPPRDFGYELSEGPQ